MKLDETVDVDQLAFTLQRRDHGEHFGLDGGVNRCSECHASGSVPASLLDRAPFWHALHMRELEPADPVDAARISAGDCLGCHAEVRDSVTLASLSAADHYAGSSRERCGSCHADAQGKPLALELALDQELGAPRTRLDFPHGPHVGKVEGECFACHSFDLAETLPFQARPKTQPDPDCLRCHANHGSIAGGACGACHGFEERWSGAGEDPRRFSAFRDPALLKDWTSGELTVAGAPGMEPGAAGSSFDHFSPGHQESTQEGECLACHEGRDGKLLVAAESILAVPIPLESDDGCRKCHVLERGRFHWE